MSREHVVLSVMKHILATYRFISMGFHRSQSTIHLFNSIFQRSSTKKLRSLFTVTKTSHRWKVMLSLGGNNMIQGHRVSSSLHPPATPRSWWYPAAPTKRTCADSLGKRSSYLGSLRKNKIYKYIYVLGVIDMNYSKKIILTSRVRTYQKKLVAVHLSSCVSAQWLHPSCILLRTETASGHGDAEDRNLGLYHLPKDLWTR